MKIQLALLSTLLLTTFSEAEDIVFSPTLQDDIIRIYASGEKEAHANSAIVTVKISALDSILREVVTRIDNRRITITNTVAKYGITAENVNAAKFVTLPDQKILSGNNRSYLVVSTLDITVTSEKQFLALANLIDTTDGMDFLSRRVEFANDIEIATAASMEALKMLKHKQAQYEAALGVKLKLISFSEIPARPGDTEVAANSTGLGRVEYQVTLEGRYRIEGNN
jgi:uncharacterized protein YggE